MQLIAWPASHAQDPQLPPSAQRYLNDCINLTHITALPLLCYMLAAVLCICSYLYVEDVAEAFDCVLHRGTTGEVYNIGTEKERTVLEVGSVCTAHGLYRLRVAAGSLYC